MTVQQKPILHGRDHASNGADPIPGGIGGAVEWEDVGTAGGGGGGIQFDVTPQSGTFLDIRTTGVQSPTTNGITLQTVSGSISIYGDTGLALSGRDPGGVFMSSQGVSPIRLTLGVLSDHVYLQDNTGAFLMLIQKVAGVWHYRIKAGASWVADL